MDFTVRPAQSSELDQLAQLWYDAWQDAHAAILPDSLRRLRTLENFRDRLEAALASTRAAGPAGAPAGFFIIKDDELYQLFVAAAARGTGIAAALLADAEERLTEAGVNLMWLACAIGNDRAARFYEKHGWRRAGTVDIEVETTEGPFTLRVWRYEKRSSR